MATLLGTWELGRGYGHIAHLAPLAQALKVRGHRMSVASLRPATAHAALGNPFAEVLEAPAYRPLKRTRTPTLTYGQVIADGGLTDLPAAMVLMRAWLALFDRVKPEAIVAEHAPASMLAAHVARLPVAIVGSGFTVPPATRPLPSLLPWTAATEADRATADAPADAVIREVCRAFGAPALDGVAALLALALPGLVSWPEVDAYGPRAGVTYYGPMGGFPAQARPAWPKATGPRAFVYLPFSQPAGRAALEALGALGWPTIWHSQVAPAAALPANVAFTPDPVDLQAVLGDAALLVSRAAHGTVCHALSAGRPNLMLPDTLESMLVARRIEAQRLGLIAPIAEVGPALERIVGDAAIAAATAAVRDRYARYRPELAAAQLADAIIGEFAL